MTDGTICTLDCSWSRMPHNPVGGDVALNIVGTDGYVSLDALNQSLMLYTEEPRVARVGWGSDMDYVLIEDFAVT